MCKQDQLGTMEELEYVRLVEDIMDINCTDDDGHTPLMLLCKHRNAATIMKDVQSLLIIRKDVKREEINGKSAAVMVKNHTDLPSNTAIKILVLLTNGIK